MSVSLVSRSFAVALNGSRHPFVTAWLILLLLTACSEPVEKTEEIRPVRAIVLTAASTSIQDEFSGEVRARIESRLGFRVGGKIVERKVDVGDDVKRGQILARIDPQDLRLAEAQAQAQVKSAQSSRDFAASELARYKGLREKNFVSQAVLDAKEAAYRAAQSSLEQAIAALRNQVNQTGYAALTANADGIVTAIDAEVGQVVAAGAPVVRMTQSEEKEVVIGVPENRVDVLQQISDVRVRTWADPTRMLPGKIREVSPVADAATRTYTVRVAVPDAPDAIRLGMTAYVAFTMANPKPMVSVPMTALVQDKASTSVWIVSNGVVERVPVTIAGAAGNDVLLAGGVAAGQTVVTAGVHTLKPGQKVSVLAADAMAQAPPAGATPGAGR